MKYLKNKENYINIPDGFDQKFFSDPYFQTNLTTMTSLKYKGFITSDDLKITEFVYDCTFVSFEQIQKFCEIQNIDFSSVDFDKLYKSAVLNKFAITDIEKYTGKLPADAKVYYCLACGGYQLLSQYSGRRIEWQPGKNVQCTKFVSNKLLSTEMYLNMLNTEYPLIDYAVKPEMKIFKTKLLKPQTVASFKLPNNTVDYIITDIFRESDRLSDIRYKISCYSDLLTTNLWKKFYPDATRQPMLILLTTNDDMAYKICEEMRATSLEIFLISTEERMLKHEMTEEGSFLRYDATENRLYEISYSFL